MKQKMIVLREARNVNAQIAFSGFAPQAKEAAAITLEVVSATPAETDDIRRETGVVGAAPAMPVHLIKATQQAAADLAGPPAGNWALNAVKALQSAYTGAGVTVAVLDTGIDPAHPAFAGVDLVRRNFTTESPDDEDGHGTHCAGTIFGRDVGGVRIGVARGVTRAIIGKVLGQGSGTTADVCDAITWAQTEGAQVISMSLGIDYVGYQQALVNRGMSAAEATSIALAGYRDNIRCFDRLSAFTSSRYAPAKSAVVVAAAGNESKRPDYSVTVAPPAEAEFFLSVGAIGPGPADGPAFEVAAFSNTNARFAAPGVAIWSARRGGGLTELSGTSMATPHVAGIAALWSEHVMKSGNFSAWRVCDEMIRSSLRFTPANATQQAISDTAYGLVQAP